MSLQFVTVDPDGVDGLAMLREYFAEIISRWQDYPATESEIDEVLADSPSSDLQGDGGRLCLAMDGDTAIGCSGIRFVDDDTAELTRMYVAPVGRRRGTAAALIAHLEGVAVSTGRTRMRLNTRSDLVEARALYASLGYVEVERFDNDPYAHHWFAKELV